MSRNGIKSYRSENRPRTNSNSRPTTSCRSKLENCTFSVSQDEFSSALDSFKLMQEHVKLQRMRIKEHDKLIQDRKLKAEEDKHQHFLQVYQKHQQDLKKYRAILIKKPKIPKKNTLSWLDSPPRPVAKTPDNGFFITDFSSSTKAAITQKFGHILNKPQKTKQNVGSDRVHPFSSQSSPQKRCISTRREKTSILIVS